MLSRLQAKECICPTLYSAKVLSTHTVVNPMCTAEKCPKWINSEILLGNNLGTYNCEKDITKKCDKSGTVFCQLSCEHHFGHCIG